MFVVFVFVVLGDMVVLVLVEVFGLVVAGDWDDMFVYVDTVVFVIVVVLVDMVEAVLVEVVGLVVVVCATWRKC